MNLLNFGINRELLVLALALGQFLLVCEAFLPTTRLNSIMVWRPHLAINTKLIFTSKQTWPVHPALSLTVDANDLSMMPPAHLLEVAKRLMDSHVGLVLENAKLSFALGECGEEKSELKDKLADYQSKVVTDHLLVEEITQLKECVKKLEEDNALLRQQVQFLQAQLENKVAPITIREAMRILERWVCFRAVGGSKTKFRSGFYCFDKIQDSNDTAVSAALVSELNNLGLSSAHLEMLAYLKDCGDYVAHAREEFTALEWEAIVCGTDEESEVDEEEANQKKLKTELIAALSAVVPRGVNGALSISDPVEKPMTKPILRSGSKSPA